MERYSTLSLYKTARTILIAMFCFTIITCFSIFIGRGISFLLATMVPQLGLIYSQIVDNKLLSVVLIVVFTVIPLALHLICYILSKKDYKWLLVAAVMIGIDFVVLVVFWVLIAGFDLGLLGNILFEAIALYHMIKGYQAGKLLNNDFTEVASPLDNMVNNNTKFVTYDRQTAKENGALKGKSLALLFAALIAVIVLSSVIMIVISKKNETLAMVLSFMILIGSVAGFVYFIILLSPYLNAPAYVYFRNEKGHICRMMSNAYNTVMPLDDLRIIERYQQAFVCTYKDAGGKVRKITIPNAYKGFESLVKNEL